MAIDFHNAAAFAPIYTDVAIVTGTRRESGASAARDLKLVVPCCVLGGAVVESLSQAAAPTYEREYTVLIRRADWVDHLPPARSDALEVSGYPTLRCASVLPFGDDWSLTCHSKEAGK